MSSNEVSTDEVKINLDPDSYYEFKRRISKAGVPVEVQKPSQEHTNYAKVFSTQTSICDKFKPATTYQRSLSASPKLEQLSTLSLFQNKLFNVDGHSGGTLSSNWGYMDRKDILEEKRTFFNGYLVIERTYAQDSQVSKIEEHKSKSSNNQDDIHPWYLEQKRNQNIYGRPKTGSFGLGSFFLFGIIFTAIVCLFFVTFYYSRDLEK